jgi:putative ABC transport system permease protein
MKCSTHPNGGKQRWSRRVGHRHPVGQGLLAGVGLAASLATVLISLPAAGPIAAIVHVTDPVAYASSVFVIVAACVLAGWIPARRAARLDPMRTLRQE